jgi:E3 ubiquitin-protein ligase RGLG
MLLSGKHSFNRKSLHHIGNGPNPYEQAITIIGKTLAAFDEDNLIPCFGFGDGIYLKVLSTQKLCNFVCGLKCANGHYSDIMAASTHDQDVFSFYPDERICNGFEEVLSRYREIVPNIRLAGYISTTYLVVLMGIMFIHVIDIVILS